jgi:dephospho-CoA kinase
LENAVLHVGLTGGIGSGKSTVARLFQALGAVVLDADRLVREMLGPGQEAALAVIGEFGAAFALPDGAVNRQALAEEVFRNGGGRERLEAILHPRVVGRRRELLKEIRQKEGASCVVVTEAALIFEAGTEREFDGIILVTAPQEVRLRRLSDAGWDAAAALRRMEAQWPDERKRPLAHWIIDNGGSPEATRRQVEALWPALEEAARARP